MDELVRLVSQKAGISEDASRKAVDTVIGFLKQRMPPQVSGQIDGLLAEGGMPKNLNDLSGDLGKTLGR